MTSEVPEKTYVLAGTRPWHRRAFEEFRRRQQTGRWEFFGSPVELSLERITELQPRYVFFLHWSEHISRDILNRTECIGFHMTDLPQGRGGSPLQNLILLGQQWTKLTAFRMIDELDAGPIYLQRDLVLSGTAEEIYLRATELSLAMIEEISKQEPAPVAQSGVATVFVRRKPEQSEIRGDESVRALHDFIRMLDAEGYPKAFLRKGGLRFEFSRSALYNGRILADVRITRDMEEQE